VKTAEVFLACILPAVSLGAFAAPPPYRVAPAPAWVMRAPDSLVTDHSKQLEAGESDFPIVDHQVRVAAATAHYERYVERVLNQEGVESAAQVSIEMRWRSREEMVRICALYDSSLAESLSCSSQQRRYV